MVNKIITGFPSNKDLNKANIFPLVNIMPGPMRFSENLSLIEYEFTISVTDVRNQSKHNLNDNITDNLTDNLNVSSAIIQKAIIDINFTQNLELIRLVSATDAIPIMFADKNLLDGFETTIVLSIPNKISACN